MRGRALGEWILLTAVLAALTGLAAWQGWLWRADQLLYDTALSLGARPAATDIVIVAIDDESLRRIGRWPWPRAVHATLVDKLTRADAATIGLDIILSEPDANDGDRVLAEAIARHGRVVLPVLPHALAPGLLADGKPAEPLRRAAAGLGHIEIQLDADGIARGLYLWGGVEEPLHPQFALALLKVSPGGTAPAWAERTGDARPAAEPGWHRDVWLHPRFAGPPGSYATVSYVDVLTGAVDPGLLSGKQVLVGATAVGLGDQYPTPMSALGMAMPGVEFHANVLDALRTGATIHWLEPGRVAAVTVVVLVALMLGLLLLSPRDGLLLSAAVGAGGGVGAILLLHWGQLWLPPGALLLGAALAYPLWSWRRLEAAQRFLDAELVELHATEPDSTAETPAERSVDPLENRIAIVRAAAERQRAIQKVRDDTMRFISHDIRSPLASIITIVAGASSGSASDSFRRLLRAEHYAQNALDLADDFFRLAKAETLDASTFEIVDLVSLAHEAADEVWPQAERKGITVTVRDEGQRDALVRGNRAHLIRALRNLLDNAIKFSPEGASIRIVLRDDDRWQELDVVDQGCGIAPEDIGKLFVRYGRITKPDQPAQPGIGLGLVIVKTVVERHGGTITLNSAVDSGTTFRVRLPRFAADDI